MYRSRILRFPRRPALRPTPDRVRETLFNWLGQDLTGASCLDLFAGSGALGFEAASRHATRVVMIERDRSTFQALGRNVALLGCEAVVKLHCTDALDLARSTRDRFDVVFLDPPYNSGLIAAIMPILPRLLRPGGAMYVESAQGLALDAPWHEHRKASAGNVTFQLFRHGDH